MKKRMLNYLNKIDSMLTAGDSNVNWKEAAVAHLVQIEFFQHERMVHLIVTVTFALLTMMAVLAMVVTQYVPLIALIVLLMVLLVPYIAHYYLLENGVQKMYSQYDKMLELGEKDV